MGWDEGKLVRNAGWSGYHVYYYHSFRVVTVFRFFYPLYSAKSYGFMVLRLENEGHNCFSSAFCLESN